MANLKKIQIVEKLVEKLQKNPNFALVNFGNLSHQKLEELRKKLRPLSSYFSVVKNSLFKVALKKIGKKEIINEEIIKGPSAVLTLPSDWTKGLSNFYQWAKNEEGISFKFGFIDNVFYQKEDLIKLAQLPSKEELLGKILMTLKTPTTRLVYLMRFGILKITYLIKLKAQSQKLKVEVNN